MLNSLIQFKKEITMYRHSKYKIHFQLNVDYYGSDLDF